MVKDEKRQYRFWTSDEVEKMKRLYLVEGLTAEEISNVLIRTASSVRDKLFKEEIKKLKGSNK